MGLISTVPRKDISFRTRLETLCNRFRKVKDLYDFCISGNLYETARSLLASEIDQAGYDPKMYMESMGWDTSEITPELAECIDLELTFDEDDVYEVMIAIGNEALEKLEEGEVEDVQKAIFYAREETDTVVNIVAKRLLEAIETCKRKGRW